MSGNDTNATHTGARVDWIILILVALPFVYDTKAYDLLSTKHTFWLTALALPLSAALLRDALPTRLLWRVGLLLLCFVPTWLRGGEINHWWCPLSVGLGLLVWWQLLQASLPSPHDRPKGTSSLSLAPPRRWLQGVILALLLMSLWVLWERWLPGWLPTPTQSSRWAQGTLGNPNHLGAWLSVGVFVCLLRGGHWRWALLTILPALWLTGSRLSLIAVTLPMSIGALLLWRQKEPKRGLLWLAVAGVLVAGSFVASPQKNLGNVASGWGGASARLHLLRCATPMVLESFPLGVGWGQFRQRFPHYKGRCLQGTKYLKDPQHTITWHLHNDWLELVIEGGSVGLLLCVWLLVWVLSLLGRPGTLAPVEQIWLGMGLLAFGLQAAGHFPLQLPSVMALVTLLLALLSWSTTPQQTTPLPKIHAPHWVRMLCLWGWALVLVLQWSSYQAERVFVQADQVLTNQDPDALELLKRSEWLFPSARAAFQRGQQHKELGQLTEARHALERAMTLQPDPEVARHLIQVYMALGEEVLARKMLKKGLELRPGYGPLLLQQELIQKPRR